MYFMYYYNFTIWYFQFYHLCQFFFFFITLLICSRYSTLNLNHLFVCFFLLEITWLFHVKLFLYLKSLGLLKSDFFVSFFYVKCCILIYHYFSVCLRIIKHLFEQFRMYIFFFNLYNLRNLKKKKSQLSIRSLLFGNPGLTPGRSVFVKF